MDKQHAVINYEPASDEHKVKDLGSLNGVSKMPLVSDNEPLCFYSIKTTDSNPAKFHYTILYLIPQKYFWLIICFLFFFI